MTIGPADLCHPVLVNRPFSAPGWLFELKHDGFRAFCGRRRSNPAQGLGQALRGSTVSTRTMKACSSVM